MTLFIGSLANLIRMAISRLVVIVLCSFGIFTSLSFSKFLILPLDSWKAPAWADSLKSPYIVEPLTLPLGEELYTLYCQSCHGENGAGRGATDKLLGLNSKIDYEKRMNQQTDGALFWKLSEGNENWHSYKEILTEEQRWQLIVYLRDIAKPYHQQENPFKKSTDPTQTVVKKTADFKINGEGNAIQWENTDWVELTLQESPNDVPVDLKTEVKMLYSETGMYFLFQSVDHKLTATIQKDFGSLFTEDVVELFLWPDSIMPLYFEYEISPLNYELALLVPNINGKFQGWRPLNYEGKIKTQHLTTIRGGEKKSNAPIKGWTAEVYIPYGLLNPIVQGSPKSGEKWKANFYRIDYDQGYTSWSWQKTTPRVRGSFHQYKKFGTLIFE